MRRSSHRPFGLKDLNIYLNGRWFLDRDRQRAQREAARDQSASQEGQARNSQDRSASAVGLT
jgi:hypothetical protein